METHDVQRSYKKPLGRSIAIGCILFTAILCLALIVLNYYSQRDSLYEHYESEITDLLHYVERHVDGDDLRRCVETLEESEKYRETLRFMDQIMNEFSIHYLYAVKPLNLDGTANVMSVLSAEDDYNRYEDTEGNLYLGWISDDEFDAETVQTFFDIMEQDDVSFFVEVTEWSTDYTGALALRDSKGEAYAVLCVDVDITTLRDELRSQALRNAAVIVCLGVLYTISFLLWTKANITEPVMLLEQGVVDYAGRSHGQRDVEALKFEAPDIKTDNEVESLSRAITQMTENMQDYVSEILSAEEKSRNMKQLADKMSELAIIDSLTGVRNKTAYNREAEKLQQELMESPDLRVGVAMIDLNFLKRINDNFGHEKGDIALKTLTGITCNVFRHSPVFRVGGDEFIVILRGQDLENIDALRADFLSQVSEVYTPEPWKQISAAIGVAFYDRERDSGIEDALKRADQEMYEMKKAMKALREDE